MTRRCSVVAGALAIWVCGCGASDLSSTGAAPRALPGARNDALRSASEKFGVPLDLLMALGYQQGRFESKAPAIAAPLELGPYTLREGVTPEEATAPGSQLPQVGQAHDAHADVETFGAMRLTAEQLRRGAALTGRTEAELAASPAASIEAAAALLAELARAPKDAALQPLSDEAFVEATLRLTGVDGSADASRLALQDLTALRTYGFELTTRDGERLALDGEARPLSRKQGLAAGAYPPVQWIPAVSANYTDGRVGEAVHFVVIHDIEGTVSSAAAVFQNPAKAASAHYGIRASDGQVIQYVSELNTAWHAGHFWFNTNSIGIEHEGFADFVDGQGNYSKEYVASAQLVCAIVRKYKIPVDRAHIFGHGNVPSDGNSRTLCSDDRAYVNRLGGCGGLGAHHDPGRYWDFNKYLGLVAQCVADAAGTTSPGTADAGTAGAGADAGTSTPPTVTPGSGSELGGGSNPSGLPSTAGATAQQTGSNTDAAGCSSTGFAPVELLALLGAAVAFGRARRRRT